MRASRRAIARLFPGGGYPYFAPPDEGAGRKRIVLRRDVELEAIRRRVLRRQRSAEKHAAIGRCGRFEFNVQLEVGKLARRHQESLIAGAGTEPAGSGCVAGRSVSRQS